MESQKNQLEILRTQKVLNDFIDYKKETDKFTKHTGWKPEISFEKTMDDLLTYWRNRIGSGRKFLRR